MNDSKDQCECCYCQVKRHNAKMRKFKILRDQGVPVETIRALAAAEAKDAQ